MTATPDAALRFSRDLRTAASADGIVPRLIADAPEEWRLGPLTVLIDRRRDTARIRYARNPIARARCDAADVLASARRAMARLRSDSVAPDRFGVVISAAYATILDRAGAPPGQRVDLIRLWPEVRRAASRRRYSRAQLSWDLARIKSEGRLVLAEGRITLEVATGAVRPSQVLWIEDAAGTGQYYRTFRLLPP